MRPVPGGFSWRSGWRSLILLLPSPTSAAVCAARIGCFGSTASVASNAGKTHTPWPSWHVLLRRNCSSKPWSIPRPADRHSCKRSPPWKVLRPAAPLPRLPTSTPQQWPAPERIVILPLFSSKEMRADWNEQPACACIAIFGSDRPRECDSDVIRKHRFPCDQISMTALNTPNGPGSAASWR